jgi:hypothetical protein
MNTIFGRFEKGEEGFLWHPPQWAKWPARIAIILLITSLAFSTFAVRAEPSDCLMLGSPIEFLDCA